MERRDRYEGLGDGLSRAFELTIASVVLGGIGLAVDRWLGTVPLFTIAFTVLALVGVGISLWYSYDARMRTEESQRVWARPLATGRRPVGGEGVPPNVVGGELLGGEVLGGEVAGR